MSGPLAKVNSVAAVNLMRVALIEFIDDVSSVLGNLDLETNRAVQWVEVDRKDYWAHQAQFSGDRVAEARVDLERKRIFTVAGRAPPCREEKLAVENARRRQHLAEEKVQTVRHWGRVIEHEVLEFHGVVNQLADFVLVELPQAVAVLERLNRSLDSYLRVEAPIDLVGKYPQPTGESVAAPATPAAATTASGSDEPIMAATELEVATPPEPTTTTPNMNVQSVPNPPPLKEPT